MHPSVEQVIQQMGGREAIKARSEQEMDGLLRKGLPVSVLTNLRDNWEFTVLELAGTLAIPRSTLMRMLERRQRMASGDSDRVYRLAALLAFAEQAIAAEKVLAVHL